MTTNASPIAAGPMNHVHRAAGATLETVNGWEVAIGYPSEPAADANAIVDVSHQPTYEINGPTTGAVLRSLCGGDLPIRAVQVTQTLEIYRLTETRAILFGFENPPDEAIDVTGGWASVGLFGPDAENTLRKITAVDLRNRTLAAGHCCQGPVFGVGTLFGRFENHYELHVCPDVLEFLWEVILDAGQEFDLKPAGLRWLDQHAAQAAKP